MKVFGASACLAMISATASYANIVNPDFSAGLTGYNLTAATNTGSVATDPFIDIFDNSGDPYVRLITPQSLTEPVTVVSIDVNFVVSAAMSVLTFDFGYLVDIANSGIPGGFVPSTNSDIFSVLIEDLDASGIGADGLYRLVDVTSAGTVLDPFLSGLDITSSASADPFFDTTVRADLSGLVGRNLNINFSIRNFFDGRQTGFGIDNINFSAAPGTDPGPGVSTVPLPATLWLLMAGLSGLGMSRKFS